MKCIFKPEVDIFKKGEDSYYFKTCLKIIGGCRFVETIGKFDAEEFLNVSFEKIAEQKQKQKKTSNECSKTTRIYKREVFYIRGEKTNISVLFVIFA